MTYFGFDITGGMCTNDLEGYACGKMSVVIFCNQVQISLLHQQSLHCSSEQLVSSNVVPMPTDKRKNGCGC